MGEITGVKIFDDGAQSRNNQIVLLDKKVLCVLIRDLKAMLLLAHKDEHLDQ